MPTYYQCGSLWIEIRPREQGHPLPHVHAHVGKYSASIALNGAILAGDLHDRKLQAEAIQWILKHKDFLEVEWRRLHV